MVLGTGMEIETLAFAAVIIFFAHTVKGATGFANALIAIPLLSLFMDIKFVVPMFLLFDFPSSGMISYQHRGDIRWRAVITVASGLILGTIIGAYFLIHLSNNLLKPLFGIIVIGFGLNLIIKHHHPTHNHLHQGWGVLSGLLGGTTGGLFGMDGPILVMYLSRTLQKASFRATLTTIFLVSSLWRGTIYLYGGILEWDKVLFALSMVPFLIVGILIGSRFQNALDQRSFNIIIGVVLMIAGVMLVL